MGEVLDPKPPQWERKQPLGEDVSEDRVTLLAGRLLSALSEEIDATVVQIAALRLLQKTVVGIYIEAMGIDAARELMKQAVELASHYTIRGVSETNGEPEA